MKKILFVVLLLSLNILSAEECHVVESSKNMVKFISDAPIEDFEGVTDKIDGYFYWEGQEFTSESELYFEVDLNTLDTGIGLRNRHMRENYLETDKWPTTSFKGTIIKSIKRNKNSYDVTVQGKMFIHGVSRDKTISGIIETDDNKTYHISSNFGVKLSDYKIQIPSIMFYKIDETMKLKLDFFFKAIEKQNK